MLFAALGVSSCAPAAYTEEQFEEALRAYLEVAREDDTDAALKLLQLGEHTGNAEMLRDATYAAISKRDIKLAQRAGEAWYAAGGEEALLLLTRIKVTTEGLAPASGMLSRLAAADGPEAVYQVVRATGSEIGRVSAYTAAHPLHLRDDVYFAYRAMLYLEAGEVAEAQAVLDASLNEFSDSISLLLVALYLAELGGEDAQSIELASRLAIAANTDVATAVIAYGQWAAAPISQRQLLPTAEEFTTNKDFPDLALLYAGRFYLRHGEPLTTIEIMQQIEANTPSRGDAVRILVAAYQQLGDGYVDTTLGLLKREIDSAPVELVPELAELYASTIEQRDGALYAYEFLDNLKRGVDDPDLLFLKSIYSERAGNLDGAEVALRRLIEIDPQSSVGYNALGYMFADNNVRLIEAKALIEKALAIEPDSPAIIDSLGWVLYRQGDLVNALKYLEDSVRRMGNQPHPEVLAHLAEVLWELGDSVRSRAILAAALAIDPKDRSVLLVLEKYQLEDVIK